MTPGRWCWMAVCWGVLCTHPLFAQPKGRIPPQFVNPEELNRAEGEAVLRDLREARWDGQYVFRFTFRVSAPGTEARFHDGWLHGCFLPEGLATRVIVHSVAADAPATHDWLFLPGPAGGVWHASGENPGPAQRLDAPALAQPMLPGLTYRPFDWQMPFLQWTDWVYEGPLRAKGRKAHNFLLYPPADAAVPPDLGAVRLTVDAAFHAPLRAQILDLAGQPAKSFQIIRFRKVADRWLIRTLDLVDEQTRARTRFEIEAAALDLPPDPATFQPEQVGREPVPPPPGRFTYLQ